MTEIVLDRVGKRYEDGTFAVDDASFTIRDGEFFILVGPSGCGKSTLMNLIVGLDVPTAGEIRIDGARANEIDARDRNMAMVFQSYALYPHMSVRENLAFPLTVARVGRDEIRRRVEQAAAMLELTDVLDRRPASLSGGQRQRAAMGRAIVREPAAFLLDEPLSNLDARLRVQMRTEIARLQKRLGTTTVYVTHDQAEAMTLGDRVAVLRGGRVQQVGTPRALYEAPENLFVAGFIGSPAMNFLPARREGLWLRLPMADFELTHDAAARIGARTKGPLVAGIRPEHIGEAAADGRSVAAGTSGFRVRAEVVEWLGAETFVHFVVGDERDAARLAEGALQPAADHRSKRGLPVVARLPGASSAREDQEIDLVVDARRVYLFDAESGRRIA